MVNTSAYSCRLDIYITNQHVINTANKVDFVHYLPSSCYFITVLVIVTKCS